MYRKFGKRFLDIVFSFLALVILSPLLLVLTILGAIFMHGNPFFTQERPGKNEKIFKLIKFRTMSNKKDKSGKLLPDKDRLNKYGRFLRSTSLDELPELLNILIGQMSFVGPRPVLTKDLIFMSEEIRRRYDVLPGLTGMAQANGRNNISWKTKFKYDLRYVDNYSFGADFKIAMQTIKNVVCRKDVSRDGEATDIDYGDWLVRNGEIKQKDFKRIMDGFLA